MAGLDFNGTSIPLPLIAILATIVILLIILALYSRKRGRSTVSVLNQKSIYAEEDMARLSQKQTAKTAAQTEAEKEQLKSKTPLGRYIKRTVNKRSTLEMDLINIGIKKTPYDFVKTMITYAIIIAVVVGLTMTILMYKLLSNSEGPNSIVIAALIGGCVGIAAYMMAFQRFMLYPTQVTKALGKNVERDILFAARDIVISMRSGMPLFNAITSVSTGYGETSKEFRKIIELVQLGMPIAQAIDEISDKSESKTFKRIMLQASVSIRSGVDVTQALQEVLDEITQERVIELRRYGQKLNALAMFYMLFGVIFPSMGIAVVTIMATFISIFPVTYILLVLTLIFVAFIQAVLLNVMRNSRPIFTL